MTTDYPLIRQSTECPSCGMEKGTKSILCWPCFNAYETAKGFIERVNEALEQTEQRYQLEARR